METNNFTSPDKSFIEMWFFCKAWQIEMLKESLRQEGIVCYSNWSPVDQMGKRDKGSPAAGPFNHSLFVAASQLDILKEVIDNFPLRDVKVTLYDEGNKPPQISSQTPQPLSAGKIIFYFLSLVLLLLLLSLLIIYGLHPGSTLG